MADYTGDAAQLGTSAKSDQEVIVDTQGSKRASIDVIRGVRGFSLIELLLTLLLLSVVLMLSAPSFQSVLSRISTDSQARTLLTSLNYARGEAIRRNTAVTVCGSSDGANCAVGAWSDGWLVVVDATNEVLRVDNGPGQGVSITFASPAPPPLGYDNMGFGRGTPAAFIICPADGDDTYAQALTITVSGRVSRERNGVVCP